MEDRIHRLPTGLLLARPAALGPSLARLGAALALWRRRLREREQLARFSDLELHDVGVTRAEALVELSKPFWRG